MQCSCSISNYSDVRYYDSDSKILTLLAKQIPLKCGECGKEIKPGDQYEWYRGEYEEEKYTHYTCLDCVSLKEHFFSEYMFESLWEDFNQHMDDCGWQVPEDCLAKVTPTTRAKICESIEREKEL